MDADQREKSFYIRHKKKLRPIFNVSIVLIFLLLSFYMGKHYSSIKNIPSSHNKFMEMKMVEENRKQKEVNFLKENKKNKERKSILQENQLNRNVYNFKIGGNVEGSNIVNGNINNFPKEKNFRENGEIEENTSLENLENQINGIKRFKKKIFKLF
ncbi:hypothetical protein ACTFIW_002676 [Dictyostelium discoideum]